MFTKGVHQVLYFSDVDGGSNSDVYYLVCFGIYLHHFLIIKIVLFNNF